MSAEIIAFTARRRTERITSLGLPAIPSECPESAPRDIPEPLTTTARNARLRLARREAWGRANALTHYWHARHNFIIAVWCAKNHALAEASEFFGISADDRDRLLVCKRFCEARDKQLLTPAPDMGAVNWKRQQLRSRVRRTDLKNEIVEKAIADDIAFLESHPIVSRKRARN